MRHRELQRAGLHAGLVLGLLTTPLGAQEAPTQQPEADAPVEERWLEPMPIPADPELEEQIHEVQDALEAINRQIVRRKDALGKSDDSAAKTKLYEELDALRKERAELDALLDDLVEEAKTSERTAIDEALSRARWLERQQDYWSQREELLRDRQ